MQLELSLYVSRVSSLPGLVSQLVVDYYTSVVASYAYTYTMNTHLVSFRVLNIAYSNTLLKFYSGEAKFVRVGDLNTASDSADARPQLFNIIERINHHQYRPPELYNDIALYKLDRAVTFDEYAKPVCLHESPSLPEGTGVATGWGRLEFGKFNYLKVSN